MPGRGYRWYSRAASQGCWSVLIPRAGAGLHTIDRRFNVFMLDFTNDKRRKGPMSCITMRPDVTLIACQYALNVCEMLVAKGIFEHGYLFIATYSQDVCHLCRFVHPTYADGGDDTYRLQ